jgi:hypothetical protein
MEEMQRPPGKAGLRGFPQARVDLQSCRLPPAACRLPPAACRLPFAVSVSSPSHWDKSCLDALMGGLYTLSVCPPIRREDSS